VLVRMRQKAVQETYLRLALRAKAKESWHRVASGGQGQRVRAAGRRMCSSCGILAVKAMEGAWLLLSLAVRFVAQPAQPMQNPAERRLARGCHAPTVLSRNVRYILHHTLAVQLPCSHAYSTHR
jgi:hypothetical protein